MRNTIVSAILLATAAAAAARAAEITPTDGGQFYLQPDQPASLEWKLAPGGANTLGYTIRDYVEHTVANGEAKVAADGSVAIATKLPQGYFEIDFAAIPRRFGVVSLPPWEGTKPDPFFAIDGAMSWLVRDAKLREQLIVTARRSGIGMIRERLTWGAVNPAADQWDWETGSRFDSLRRACAMHGVAVLEMAHDGPAWLGRVAKYPADLIGAARSWQEIARHWRPTWGALEVWNEPDIFFGGDLPADQYVPLVRTIAYGLSEKKIDVPVVGGVVAHYNREYLDTAAENGLLDSIDAFSFHTYGRAMEMESLVANYRDWLRAHGHADMPLWITECGRPWKKGPHRPPAGQDAASAVDIVMKAVEARAAGIARHFPFVYPYYEENDNNFGMNDRQGTPLRAMAGYAQMIRALGRRAYLGSLEVGDPAARRAPVFGEQGEAVAVIYTGQVAPEGRVKWDLPIVRAEGIDGRILTPTTGTLPVPDGMTYVWLDRASLAARLKPATATQRRADSLVLRRKPSPFSMRLELAPDLLAANSRGYKVKQSPAGRMKLTVRIFNQSDVDCVLPLVLDGLRTIDSETVSTRTPARGSATASWDVDFGEAFRNKHRAKVSVACRPVRLADNSPALVPPPLVFYVSGEVGLPETLSAYKHSRLPIEEAARWKSNIAGHGEMTMTKADDVPWRLTTKFKETDRWVYPYFDLPPGVDLTRSTGLVIRAKCHKPAEVRVFLWEGDKGVGYITPDSIIEADGKWHVATVRFDSLVQSAANAPDPDGRLQLSKVRRISLGMNSRVPENVLDVTDMCLVEEK